MVMRKLGRGIVGIGSNGTVFVTDEKIERELKARGIKVIRAGKVKAL